MLLLANKHYSVLTRQLQLSQSVTAFVIVSKKRQRKTTAYSETVEFVDEWQIGADITVVMSNVNERLKQVSRKHSLEVSTISLHTEQESQST